ncbi:MAG: hypothetical protein Q4G68_08845, partial [Planctomycetia bacterium]|nr:hypothetical protein [Planctomycetia bacterium]
KYVYYFMNSLFWCFLEPPVGCEGGSAAPEGFPDLVPYRINVMDGATPVEGVNVQLVPQEKMEWTAGGATDAAGKLAISTIQFGHAESGVPVGTYKVVLSKMEEAPSAKGLSMEEYREKSKGFKSKQFCPKSLTDASTTPLTAEVSKGGELTIDLTRYK